EEILHPVYAHHMCREIAHHLKGRIGRTPHLAACYHRLLRLPVPHGAFHHERFHLRQRVGPAHGSKRAIDQILCIQRRYHTNANTQQQQQQQSTFHISSFHLCHILLSPHNLTCRAGEVRVQPPELSGTQTSARAV